MIVEIVKILADEPEKIEKALLRGVKFLINILIASQLYVLFFGKYEIIEFLSYREWVNFFISGRFLICLFFYFISDYFIVEIIEFISLGFATFITRIKIDFETDDYRKILKILRIVHYKDDMDIPLPGKNFTEFLEFTTWFEKEDIKDRVNSFKDSFIRNVLDIYTCFLCIFFIIISKELHTLLLDFLVVFFFLVVVIFYGLIHGVFEYMITNHQIINTTLSFVKIYEDINNIFLRNEIYLQWGDKEKKLDRFKVFKNGDDEYVLIFLDSAVEINKKRIGQILETRRANGRCFIIIGGENSINGETQRLIYDARDVLSVFYTDIENLKNLIQETITTIKGKNSN